MPKVKRSKEKSKKNKLSEIKTDKKDLKDNQIKILKKVSKRISKSNLEQDIENFNFLDFSQFFLNQNLKSKTPVLKQVAPIKDLEQIQPVVGAKKEDDKAISYKEDTKRDYTGRQEYQSQKDRKYSDFDIGANIGQVDFSKQAFFRNPEINSNVNDNYKANDSDYQTVDMEKRVDHRVDHRKRPLKEGNF